MPGDEWQKFANLRTLIGNEYLQPGKKLLFMGGEFGQWKEWSHDEELDWDLLSKPMHQGVQRWVQDLNRFYCQEPVMYELDTHSDGFEWVDCLDNENSVISFIRRGKANSDIILAVFNLMTKMHDSYRIGVPCEGIWDEVLNSDAEIYGGYGLGNYGRKFAEAIPAHQHRYSLNLTLPQLSCLVFKYTVKG
jgi:1,4-alpha-glucan branching enzyme